MVWGHLGGRLASGTRSPITSAKRVGGTIHRWGRLGAYGSQERMEVLITILLDRDTDLELLEASTANIDDYEINDKRRLLAEMFRVARRFKEFHHPDNRPLPQYPCRCT